jgi:serine/threonine protein kinase
MIKDTRADHTRELTHALRVLGTPSYMAPERIEKADSADPLSALYALGAVAYFALAGVPPFAADSDLTLAYHAVHSAPQPLAQRGATVPAALERLVMQCLEKDPARRPQTAAAITAELDALREREYSAVPLAVGRARAERG